jgi:Holliday junction resolvasome RuvABC endonuclease subunit
MPRRPWQRRPAVAIAGAVAVIVLACVLVDLPQHSSPAQQAAGLATVMKTINSEARPCAYAVSTAFSLRNSQDAGQLTAAEQAKMGTLLEDDLTACTLTNQTVVNLGTLTLPDTAAGRQLGTAVKGILDWETEDAVAAIGAIQVLRLHPGDAAARAELSTSERRLATDRAAVEKAVRDASRELGGADIGAPALPQLPRPS